MAVAVIAVALVLVTPTLAAKNPDGVAGIIGNKSYPHPDVPEVSFAHNDNDAIKHYVI